METITRTLTEFDRLSKELARLHNEMIEDSIAEVLAWRMYGIDANWYWLQGEFVVEVSI